MKPYRGLDDEGQEMINAFLEELKRSQQTMVVATSNPTVAGIFSDRAYLLKEGYLKAIVQREHTLRSNGS